MAFTSYGLDSGRIAFRGLKREKPQCRVMRYGVLVIGNKTARQLSFWPEKQPCQMLEIRGGRRPSIFVLREMDFDTVVFHKPNMLPLVKGRTRSDANRWRCKIPIPMHRSKPHSHPVLQRSKDTKMAKAATGRIAATRYEARRMVHRIGRDTSRPPAPYCWY